MKQLVINNIARVVLILAALNLNGQDYTITNETSHDQNHFGWHISGDGNYSAISDPRDAITDYGNGSVSVYKRRSGGWQFMQRLTQDSPEKHELFGHKTVMHRNFLAVSAIGNSTKGFMSGSVFLYQLQGDSWTLITELLPEKNEDKLYFGAALAMNDDYLVVGASGASNHTGEVYVFSLQGGNVTLQQTIDPAHPVPYEFGKTLELIDNMLLIGAPSTAKSAIKGGVFVYEFQDGEWQKTQDLEPEDEEAGSWFGYSVSADEDDLFISAPHNNVKHSDNNEYAFAGKVYHYTRSATDGLWDLNTEILEEVPFSHNFFGYQLQVDNEELFVSAPSSDATRKDQGVIYKYVKSSGAWELSNDYLTSGETQTHLGHSFQSINGEILVGNGGQKKNPMSGKVFVFDNGFEFTLNATKESDPIQVNVYPNPAVERVNIEVDEFRAHKLGLYDLKGRQLLSKVFIKRTEIDVTNLQPGLYILSFKTKNQSISKSLLVR